MTELNTPGICNRLKDFDASRHSRMEVKGDVFHLVPDGKGIGWFSDSWGSFRYEELDGNFMIETVAHMRRKDGGQGAPQAQFSSAGLLVRDPAARPGKQRWVMYNIGMQNSFYGREIKVTRPSRGPRLEPTYYMGLRSLSTLYLMPAAQYQPVRLRLARIGDEIRAYYFADGAWHEETPVADMEVMGNGAHVPVEQFDTTMFRPRGLGLPQRVQAGIIVNPGMDMKRPFRKFRDGYAEFSYYGSREIMHFEECLL